MTDNRDISVDRSVTWIFNDLQSIKENGKDLYFRKKLDNNFCGQDTDWEIICCMNVTSDAVLFSVNKITPLQIAVNFECTVQLINCHEEDNIKTSTNHFIKVTKLSELLENLDFVKDVKFSIRLELKELMKDNARRLDHLQGLTRFEMFHNVDLFSDFLVVCSDGQKIPVHRNILAAGSSVFKVMFQDSMKEANCEKVEITDIDGPTMIELLRFIYTGKVDNIDEIAPILIYAAEKYDLADLKEMCSRSMIKNLSTSNAVEFLILADRFTLEKLSRHCIYFISRNYADVRNHREKWKQLEADLITLVMDFIQEEWYNDMEFTSSLEDGTSDLIPDES